MSASELKLDLIQAIVASEDLVLLNLNPTGSTVYQFTNEQTSRVNESLE